LHSTIKLRDSWSPRGVRPHAYRRYGTFALYGRTFHYDSSDCVAAPWPLHYNSTASGSFRCGFKHRLFPVHSPLLRESRLFSCPPLNDMLKFSGFSCIAEVAVYSCWSICQLHPSKMFSEFRSRHFESRDSIGDGAPDFTLAVSSQAQIPNAIIKEDNESP
jgi:hypothetical protein